MSTLTVPGKEDMVDLSGIRQPYETGDAEADFSEKDPFKLFHAWFNLARNTPEVQEPNAMAIATADASGKPSVRFVYLKGYGKDGFHFCTNYESRKGREMKENPKVALLFYWGTLKRQVRIEGTVTKLDEKESERYFYARPRSSQITASISYQSSAIEGKDVLLKRYQEMDEKYGNESTEVPKPSYWGGYNVMPTSFEFWCGRQNRMHERLRFRYPVPGENPDGKVMHIGEDGWIYEYLAP